MNADPPRWTVDFTNEELRSIVSDDGRFWSGLHVRQAARELARRAATPKDGERMTP